MNPLKQIWKVLSSLNLTVALLAFSMVLVFFGTLDQVRLGTFHAVKYFFESWVTLWPYPLPGEEVAYTEFTLLGKTFPMLRLPLPGGFFLGALLLLNLFCAHFRYFRASWKKAGIVLIHGGMVLLLVSGFLISYMKEERVMSIDEGGRANFASSFRDNEFVLKDLSNADHDTVYAIDAQRLAQGDKVAMGNTGLTVQARLYYRNAPIGMADTNPGVTPVNVSRGFASARPVVLFPSPPNFDDQQPDTTTAVVELFDSASGESLGTWLVSNVLEGQFPPQEFMHGGRRWSLELRFEQLPLPFYLKLENFRHIRYPGVETPHSFESDVRIQNPNTGEDRLVTIKMNHPLRYAGLTFYQRSFGNNDTTSILDVVRNPAWTLPYIAVALVGAGLMLHFVLHLLRYLRREKSQAASSPRSS